MYQEPPDTKTMTEPDMTAEIDMLTDRLTVLYAARRGQRIPSKTPGHQWVWCVGCGQRMVDNNAGFDTCSVCVGPGASAHV